MYVYTKATVASHIDTVGTKENTYTKGHRSQKKLKIHYKGFNSISNMLKVSKVAQNN